jgi:hypothetical protein
LIKGLEIKIQGKIEECQDVKEAREKINFCCNITGLFVTVCKSKKQFQKLQKKQFFRLSYLHLNLFEEEKAVYDFILFHLEPTF